MKNVSKQIFLKAIVCPTMGWLLRTGAIDRKEAWARLGPGAKFRMEQGLEIGRRARAVYPAGQFVREVNLTAAEKHTREWLSNPDIPVIFEGAFLVDGFVARADILRREGDGWHLVEVKSSTNSRDEFIDDMAYTAMVLERGGVPLSGVSLWLISRDFRLGMDNAELFARIDHTDQVRARVEEFKPLWSQIDEITRAPVKPEARLRFECRQCDIFGECLGSNIENHVFDLPRLNQSQFEELMASSISCLEDIPDGFPLTGNQGRVRECVRTNVPFVGEELKDALASIQWPAYYLDFEAVMTAIPLYPDIAPYTQLPTQYSIHQCSRVGLVVDHREYLADPARDCRRELAENLIRDLGESGSIIVYATFEKVVINGLARLYPDLAEKLNSLVERLVDLEAIIRNNYYHPDFHGSNSIKVTCPVLAPEVSYSGLDIADGDAALVAFACLAQGRYKDEKVIESVKKNLLVYCQQDTMAMVRLHQRLAELT